VNFHAGRSVAESAVARPIEANAANTTESLVLMAVLPPVEKWLNEDRPCGYNAQRVEFRKFILQINLMRLA
jgi:hypothetical protein